MGSREGHTGGVQARLVAVAAVLVSAASGAVLLWVLTRPDLAVPKGVTGPGPQWGELVGPLTWTLTGAVLVWLRPRNFVGALVLFSGVCIAVSSASGAYGMYGLGIADPAWPGARWVALFGTPLWVPGSLLAISVLFACYPDGRLPGRYWRLPVAAAVLGIAMLTVAALGRYNAVAPGPAPLHLSLPTVPKVALAGVMLVSFQIGRAHV